MNRSGVQMNGWIAKLREQKQKNEANEANPQRKRDGVFFQGAIEGLAGISGGV